jgi:hypothetical protein
MEMQIEGISIGVARGWRTPRAVSRHFDKQAVVAVNRLW